MMNGSSAGDANSGQDRFRDLVQRNLYSAPIDRYYASKSLNGGTYCLMDDANLDASSSNSYCSSSYCGSSNSSSTRPSVPTGMATACRACRVIADGHLNRVLVLASGGAPRS